MYTSMTYRQEDESPRGMSRLLSHLAVVARLTADERASARSRLAREVGPEFARRLTGVIARGARRVV